MSEFARELTDLITNLAADANDPGSVWGQLCELGLAGIGMPEDKGGSGGSLADLVVVVRELARAGLNTPIVEASTTSYAVDSVSGGEGFDTIVVVPELDVSSKVVTANLTQVPFADRAARLVIVTASSVVTVPLAGESVAVEPSRDIADLPDARVNLAGASAAHISGGPGVAQVIDRLALARSAALLGTAWGAYELTRKYVTEREQFGAPLVKIPAVSTALAQMAVRTRFAQSALDRATAACAGARTPESHRFGAVSAARITAATAATLVARTSHQLHGAVGITAEYDLHRYTSKLWALRDADQSEFAYCGRLGTRVRDEGEIQLWESISA
ncbi:acyl-CoA/acyl-ACP dehydrogenase [Mycobacterium sp. Aquia_216]|uniref:acyl-CoA dehydrogenase family protein n=1 Tax=Mycobacterium sp. Aquia_216 TaxID=2991729 RepID=UPI00227AD43F|nr:acyl-CoA dehydrogenase family protein [Mycobacterium sp. Aquia_216]WAJ43317.1 acyl-CoA/acyl-ACP dehydrogenase [Mycobacterium sp. Aquia_216]